MNNNPNNFLASIAVFAELCDKDGEIINIISDFVKSVFAIEKQWTADSFEITQMLKKHFDFDIPEAVVKNSLNKLVNNNFVKKDKGKYRVVDQSFDIAEITKLIETQKTNQNAIESQLVQYYEEITKHKCDKNTKRSLIDSLVLYLFDKNISDHYTTIISSFIIKNSNNDVFVNNLNQIKEGLVLLTGLKYTSNINEIGNWNDELTIYLDTEHLFNLANYNGEIFKRLFDDFQALVNEVNQASYKRNKKKVIYLKYFADVKREVDNFFAVAEKIIKREQNLSPENIAMEEICKGCTSVSDVVRKKTDFESMLRERTILIQEEQEYLSKPEFNVEDQDLITKYEKEFEVESILETLHSFTKINFLRRGVNRTSFEKCKHIILTGKQVSIILSKDLEIKNEAKDIPFVTDIYFLTNRLWFKLNKGFSKNSKLPSSFDVITKSKIALSSLANSTVNDKYDKLQNDVQTGKMSQENAQYYYLNLREKTKRPEEINTTNVSETVKFIYDDNIESYSREQSMLKEQVRQGEAAKNELFQIKFNENQKRKRKKKLFINTLYLFLMSVYWMLVFGIVFGTGWVIYNMITPNDTPLSIIGTIIPLGLEIFALFRYSKKLTRWIKKKEMKFMVPKLRRKKKFETNN